MGRGEAEPEARVEGSSTTEGTKERLERRALSLKGSGKLGEEKVPRYLKINVLRWNSYYIKLSILNRTIQWDLLHL